MTSDWTYYGSFTNVAGTAFVMPMMGSVWPGGPVDRFFAPLVPGRVTGERCEYCGRKNKLMDNDMCISCGAPLP